MPSRIFIEKKISAWLQRIDWLWLGAKGIGELRLKSVLIYHSENPRTLPNSVQLLSHVQLFATPWTTARQGFPVHHQLSELIQIHVHRVGDAIQPSHPMSSRSPLAFKLSQHQSLFQWVNSPPNLHMFSSMEALHTQSFWNFMGASLQRHNLLSHWQLIQPPVPLPFPGDQGVVL